MGNALGKSRAKHEKLNEHSDAYFDKVEARNSFQQVGGRNWCGRSNKHRDRLAQDETKLRMASTFSTSPIPEVTSPASFQTSLSSKSSFPLTPVETMPQKGKRGISLEWDVPQNGMFLQLPTALQLYDRDGSKSSGASADSPLERRDLFGPLISPLSDDLNSEFDVMSAVGAVWVEVARKSKATAVAMSQASRTSASMPLLVGIGNEDGLLSITEILDDSYPASNGKIQDGSRPCKGQRIRKFGKTIDVSLDARVRSIDFSSDGKFVVTGDEDCVATVLRLLMDAKDENNQSLAGITLLRKIERVDRICCVQFRPDCEMLGIGGYDGKFTMVETNSLLSKDATPRMIELSHFGLILSFDWNSDGVHTAIGTSKGSCIITDSSFATVHEINLQSSIQSVCWNNDGSLLAVGSRDVCIMERGSFSIRTEIGIPAASDHSSYTKQRTESLCWNPDGKFLAVGTSTGTCVVFETTGFTSVFNIQRSANIEAMAWGELVASESGCRRYLAICDGTKSVAIVKAGADIEKHGSNIEDSMSYLSSSALGEGQEWILTVDSFKDVDEVETECLIPEPASQKGKVTSVAFSCAGAVGHSSLYIAYVYDNCSLAILSASDWNPVFQMEFAKPITTIAFANTKDHLAVAGEEGVLYVLSVPTRSMILNTIFEAPIVSLAFSRHDERLSIASDDGVLTTIKPNENWESAGDIELSSSPILCHDWSSSAMALGREDGSVAIFEMQNLLSNFFVPSKEYHHNGAVRCVCFGAGGDLLAVAGEAGVISVYNKATRWSLFTTVSVESPIDTISWSHGGRYMAFTKKNQPFTVVDTLAWTEVNGYAAAQEESFKDGSWGRCVDWSLDGKWIACGTHDDGLKVFGTKIFQHVSVPYHLHSQGI